MQEGKSNGIGTLLQMVATLALGVEAALPHHHEAEVAVTMAVPHPAATAVAEIADAKRLSHQLLAIN